MRVSVDEAMMAWLARNRDAHRAVQAQHQQHAPGGDVGAELLEDFLHFQRVDRVDAGEPVEGKLLVAEFFVLGQEAAGFLCGAHGLGQVNGLRAGWLRREKPVRKDT